VREVDADIVREIATLVARARRILFITGAGISADSGLPTYRGIGGLYDDAATDDGIPIEAALSGEMLARRPEVCWKYIHQIEQACRGAKPNRAHEVIAAIERANPDTWVLTQNVDGLHGDAGSANLIEIHGTVRKLACTRCSERMSVTSYAGMTIPPSCAVCGALVRPEVVLFGEMLPSPALGLLSRELSRGFDLVFTIGTTSVFPYIAEPVARACRQGLPTIEINPGETEVSHLVSHRLRTTAASALDAIANALS
jgi:NAD-dependent deacetylase